MPLPNSNQKVKAQIWDTSGSKDFLDITTTHYRFAVGAFIVYDVTNRKSFLNLKDWLYKVKEYSDRAVVIALIGNKADLVDREEGLFGFSQQ
jgi:small GTP-binding protein